VFFDLTAMVSLFVRYDWRVKMKPLERKTKRTLTVRAANVHIAILIQGMCTR
jgi:hypothetical protein